MSPSKTKLLLLLAAPALPAFACGPFFPTTIINSQEAILAAPYARYADSLARLSLPSAEFRSRPPVTRTYPAQSESSTAQTIAAELLDLAAAGVPGEIIERHRIRRATLAELPAPATGQVFPRELARADDLPPEFADYHAGAIAYAQGDPAVAAQHWQRLLARPATERKYKSTWAAYMLGRLTAQPAAARAYFQQVRELARAGFVDSLGLAAASLGWEAKTWLDAGDFARAADLYFAQLATGDPTAANSLRFVATRVLASPDPAALDAFAHDTLRRETITALLLSQREDEMFPQFTSGTPNVRTGATARWLGALETAHSGDIAQAPRLALAAYRAGEYTACERWLALAPTDDSTALWLRAKLAVRAGQIKEATGLLTRLVHLTATTDAPLSPLRVASDDVTEPLAATAHLRAELAALKLASRDYTEALDLLLQSRCWEDAAYVAERVLTVDELKAYLATPDAVAALHPPASAEDHESYTAERDLRHLLARRLVRHNRLDEARAYFPEKLASIFDQFATSLRSGHDRAQPSAVRAAALMDAARLLRSHGMELRGTELAPDFAIWEGSFDAGFGLPDREQLPLALRATQDEHYRASAQDTGFGQRFHYRYFAADLAWEAIAQMPDNSDVTARALIEAGSWLKARDPGAANRFYRALVQRCGETELGRAAARQHWFPRAPL